MVSENSASLRELRELPNLRSTFATRPEDAGAAPYPRGHRAPLSSKKCTEVVVGCARRLPPADSFGKRPARRAFLHARTFIATAVQKVGCTFWTSECSAPRAFLGAAHIVAYRKAGFGPGNFGIWSNLPWRLEVDPRSIGSSFQMRLVQEKTRIQARAGSVVQKVHRSGTRRGLGRPPGLLFEAFFGHTLGCVPHPGLSILQERRRRSRLRAENKTATRTPT